MTIKTSETGTRLMPKSTRHQLGSPLSLVRAQLPLASNSGLRFPSTAFSAPLDLLCLDDCSAGFLRARFSVKMNLNKILEGEGKDRQTAAKPRTTTATTTASLPVNSCVGQISLPGKNFDLTWKWLLGSNVFIFLMFHEEGLKQLASYRFKLR